MTIDRVFGAELFRNKQVLITGAGGGIGRACVRAFAAAGADILLSDIGRPDLLVTVESLQVEFPEARFRVHSGDLTQPSVRAELVDSALAFGVDHFIPAAGIYPEASLENIEDSDWDRVLEVNLTSVFALTRELVPHIRERGSIVNFGSIAGARGSAHHSHYAATKGAIASFSRSIAMELASRRIRVNTVAPGIIATAMTDDLVRVSGGDLLKATPLGRFGTPEEIAAVVVFLCSDGAGFITGETIHVNGGLYMAS